MYAAVALLLCPLVSCVSDHEWIVFYSPKEVLFSLSADGSDWLSGRLPFSLIIGQWDLIPGVLRDISIDCFPVIELALYPDGCPQFLQTSTRSAAAVVRL